MDQTIKKLLTENRVEGTFHSHVSMITPRGKFMFNRQKREEFWSAYCELIQSTPEPVIGIAEKPQQYLPVLVDVDLRIRDESDENKDTVIPDSLYSESQLKHVVGIYQSVLRQILNDVTDEDLTCVVLEKDMYQQTKNDITYFKHGFHLHFPIFIDKNEQEIHIIPRVQQAISQDKLFQNLGIEDSGTVIDKACTTVPWLLYGSRKTENHKPYLVTKIYNADLSEISLEKAFKSHTIFNNKDQAIPLKGQVHFFLPRILSITPDGRPIKRIKHGLVSPIKEKLKKERKVSTVQKRLSTEESLVIAKRLLPMLSDFRASDFNEWMTIGWTLYNIFEGDMVGLELWMDFSARCEEKYDEGACAHKWNLMTKNETPGFGTLRLFASLDSPEEYKKFKGERSNHHIQNSVDGSHNDIAKALFEEYGDEFRCASISGKSWYQFVDHHWEKIEEGVYLREKISSGTVTNKFVEAIKSLYDEIKDCSDKARTAMIQARIKQLNNTIKNTKNSNFKSAVLRECMEVFYDPRFNDKLDADPYLIAFKNGVYDLRLNVFRPGRPEDYLSKFMPINYVNYTEDDEKVQDVYTFLEQIFPDKSIKKYFLDVSSDIFVGGNHEKIVLFWTGEGDNGKSVLQKFFDIMLGKLCIKLNTNVITGKKPNAGTAFADLARTGGGVRLAVLEEPDSDEMINSGIFKHISGGDNFYARDLFEKGKESKEINPLFKLVFVCNKLPRFKAADKAVWNRARVIPFETVFCRPDNPAPESYEEQLRQKRFPMDKFFSKKIPTLVEAFCWILLQHRIKIANSGRVEPPKVLEATENYRKQNDIYRQFIDEMIYDKDKEKSMALVELYNLFKEWFKESLPGHSVPGKNEVEEYFVKAWGTPQAGKKWKGYRQRTIQDSLDTNATITIPENEIIDYQNPNLPLM